MTDRGRCNVAVTRAKGVYWIVGGDLGLAHPGNRFDPLSPFPKLKNEMAKLKRVHKLAVDLPKRVE